VRKRRISTLLAALFVFSLMAVCSPRSAQARDLDIPVGVVWNGSSASSATVHLWKSDGESTTKVTDAVLTSGNAWTYTFDGQPEYDSSGNKITYSLTADAIEGFVSVVSGSAETGFTVTYTISTSVTVQKEWVGGEADSATFQLYANGVAYGNPVVLDAEDSWSYTWTDLVAVDQSIETITYTVQETDVPDGYLSSGANAGSNQFIFTNIKTADVSGTVVWDDSDDQDGIRPDSVTVNLLRDGTMVGTTTVTADSDGTWSFLFEDMPLYDSSGNEYEYTVEEDGLPSGYTSSVSGDVASGFVITNTHEPETVSVSVKKEWVGEAADSVTVHLLADGEETGKTLVLSEDNGWTGTFDGLAKYSAGEEIAYTVAEDAVDGYTSTITGDAESGFVITNTQAATEATSSVIPAKDVTPKTGDDGTSAASLAAIAFSTLAAAIFLRRRTRPIR
jgi:LPXTG-motif cell wall-anchored protein